ncbi:MAG: DUF420 domain-containing protein [Pyrinomonadaceae bacterium]
MSALFPYLPHINALLNGTCALLLIAGYLNIRAGKVSAHRACQLSAVVVSLLFLVSYITYHYQHGTTRFEGQGFARPLYFTILTSHTILAVAIVPLVSISLYRALRGDFVRHRKIARITLPLWLYVSITGVVVYLMLYRIYPS